MSEIIFDIKPRVSAMGAPRFKEFIECSERIANNYGIVDSGLKEGKLYTKQAYLALIKGLRHNKSPRDIFDPRDLHFDKIDWKETKLPQWAIDSAINFAGICLNLKLAIRIPY